MKMKDSELPENCAFCKIEGSIIRSGKFFLVTNRYPYDQDRAEKGLSRHLMIIPDRHVKYFHELTKEEQWDFAQFRAKVLEIYIGLYKHAFTFGRLNMPEQSMYHLHEHIIDRDFRDWQMDGRRFFDPDPIDPRLKEELRKLK